MSKPKSIKNVGKCIVIHPYVVINSSHNVGSTLIDLLTSHSLDINKLYQDAMSRFNLVVPTN